VRLYRFLTRSYLPAFPLSHVHLLLKLWFPAGRRYATATPLRAPVRRKKPANHERWWTP